MKKPPLTMNEKFDTVQKRYGKTLGASKGKKPLPPATTTMRPTGGLKPTGVKVQIKKPI